MENYLISLINLVKLERLQNSSNLTPKTVKTQKKIQNKNANNNNVSLTQEQKDIIIGLMLGDGHLERRKLNHNTRLRIDHTYPKQENYVKHLYEKFKNLTGSSPKIIIRSPDIRTNKIYKSISFKTLNQPCLNYYHKLFYQELTTEIKKNYNLKAKFVKIVPNNIESLLTPVSLAHWLMGDGYRENKAIILCTESFNSCEIELLISALKDKFGIICSKQKRLTSYPETRYRIKIKRFATGENANKLKNLVFEYIIPEMVYKLGNHNAIKGN